MIKKIFLHLLLVLQLTLVLGQTISSDETLTGDQTFNDLNVNSGITLGINGAQVSVDNGLDVEGTLDFEVPSSNTVTTPYFNVTSGSLTVGTNGNLKIVNSGTVVPSYKFNVDNFINKGTITLSSAAQYFNPEAIVLSVMASGSFINEGTMTLDHLNIILLENTTLVNNNLLKLSSGTQIGIANNNFQGTGIIDLSGSGFLWFDNPGVYGVGEQTIKYNDGFIFFNSVNGNKEVNLTLTGYGSNSALMGFTTAIDSIDYDDVAGILTVKSGGNTYNFNIGTNFDAGSFVQAGTSPINNPVGNINQNAYLLVYGGTTIPPLAKPYTTYVTDKGIEHEIVVSYISTKDDQKHPITLTTTSTVVPPLPNISTSIVNDEGVTEYLVYSYYTTTNDQGGEYTTSTTVTYSPPAVTTIDTESEHEHFHTVVSYFVTVDSAGEIVTGSTVVNASTSYDPAPSATTVKIDRGDGVTEYEVISYWLTSSDNGEVYTASNSSVYSPPAVTTTATTNNEEAYVETDVISYFITTDGQGEIVTESAVVKSRQKIDSAAAHSSLGPAPPNRTTTVDLGNNVTEYVVISYWVTTDSYGGFVTASNSSVYSPPAVTTTATTNNEEAYVETDVISYFITTDGQGEIVTESAVVKSRQKIDSAAAHSSLGPAPPNRTTTVDLGNNVTEYVVISYWVTTDSYGGFVTASNSSVYSPPAVTTTATTNNEEAYVETDVISYFITTDGQGEIVTESAVVKSRQKIDSAAAHSSLGPAPPNRTTTVDLGNNVTEYVVISYWVTTDSYGGFVTASNSSVYSPPAVTTTATTNNEEAYVETDVISYFITTDGQGEIVTESAVVKSRQKIDSAAAHSSLGPAPPNRTTTVDLGNNVTEYVVISYWVTTDSYGGFVTASNSSLC
ncbi:uncharacterized protein RNJ42_03676 [Nakaseomyces bracarensis]|uniref:uncharacterized protein n=1 Tax=Nakaseomyces bracarensis TaxID=273131 RepID=UPI0038728A3E